MIDDAEIYPGTKIGKFVVERELGSGGMGIVFEAHDRELDRRVALKVLRGTRDGDEDRLRILREGQAMARVTHANVITVYEVGVDRGLVFLAQELLDGGTLQEWLEEPRPVAAVIDKFIAAGRGIAAAHAAGLVHRDFKPDNVLLGKDGRVRVADFGLARALSSDDARAAVTRVLAAAVNPMSPLTRTGAILGTPMFMSPEQHDGKRADERSDQFSFCVALYHALYGAWPFEGKTSVALADAVIKGRIQRPPRGRGVPARVRGILMRGLATEPGARFPSMDALLAELGRPPSRSLRRVALGLALVAAIGGAVVGGYALSRSSPPERTPTVGSAPPPPLPVDPKTLADDRAIEWLSIALERGQLDDAIEKYELAAALKQQAGQPAPAAIAWSAGAFTLVLRGRLADASARLERAEAGDDPVAAAHADLAGAAIAAARGELGRALERAGRCGAAFVATPGAQPLAAICMQLRGEILAHQGDAAGARAAFEDALAFARKHDLAQRASMLELALAELELDGDRPDDAARRATAVQAAAGERGAVTVHAHATAVLARVQIARADPQQALAELAPVDAGKLQTFAIAIAHQLARGQAMVLLGDPTGLEEIEAARRRAEQAGHATLMLEARLAHVAVLLLTDDAGAAAAQRALVADARKRGHLRIARLAETVMQR